MSNKTRAAGWRAGCIAIVQVVSLGAVLLTWPAVDRLLEFGMSKHNELHVWFGAPKTPAIIHVGEILNTTIEWTAKIKSRSSYITLEMELGVRCSGKDGNISYFSNPFIIDSKWGKTTWEYPMLEADLKPGLTDALCYLNLKYEFEGHGNFKSNLKKKDKTMSSVFKLSRGPRVTPLPQPTGAVLLDPARLALARQLRPMPVVKSADTTLQFAENQPYVRIDNAKEQAKLGKSGVLNVNPANQPPSDAKVEVHRAYDSPDLFRTLTIWLEDDRDLLVDVMLFEKWKLWFGVAVIALVLAVLSNHGARKTVFKSIDAIDSWWNRDITRSTTAYNATVRSGGTFRQRKTSLGA
ncbi:hypothetical protein HDU76_002386 [Blyttiomyces sp. JEL0837]|nr:hypothetical protein HDU76_002386 [Blyttiomyces sp. JEL0837]